MNDENFRKPQLIKLIVDFFASSHRRIFAFIFFIKINFQKAHQHNRTNLSLRVYSKAEFKNIYLTQILSKYSSCHV